MRKIRNYSTSVYGFQMNILFLYAHADDESLGAGGTIPKWLARGHGIQLLTLSDGLLAKRERGGDNRAAYTAACQSLGLEDFRLMGYPDQAFETVPIADLVNAVAAVAKPFDLLVTHDPEDLNRDHRIVAEVGKVLARPRGKQLGLLFSEIPCSGTWNGRPFAPNFYVDIGGQMEEKLDAFGKYAGEVREESDPFSIEGLKILARQRGLESGCRFAEGFRVGRLFDGMI